MRERMMSRLLQVVVMTAVIAVFSSPALAHLGHDISHTVLSGFLHPLSGLDHILAMVAVGLLAFSLGGAALWLVPLAFVLMMAVGVVFSGRCLRGSCGGPEVFGPDGESLSCAACPRRKERRAAAAAEGSAERRASPLQVLGGPGLEGR